MHHLEDIGRKARCQGDILEGCLGDPRIFDRLKSRGVAVGAALAAVGLVLTVIAAEYLSGFWNTFTASIASALMSIGGLTLIYDVFLKEALANDILDAVQVARNLHEAGVVDVRE